MKVRLIEANCDLGVNVNGAHLGPRNLTRCFEDIDLAIVDKPKVRKQRKLSNLKKNLNSVNVFNKNLYNTVLEIKNNGEFPLTIGGDHSIAIASSLGSIKNEEKLGVIWIDAHGDYNTFDTTRTGNLHGLPLAAINGNCASMTEFHDGNYFSHSNTVIVGGRDIDSWEMPNIIKDNITLFTTDDIRTLGVKKVMEEAFKIASKDVNGVHVSFDLDVIDPSLAPGISVPAGDGINLEEVFEIVNHLINNKDLIKSMDLVEFNPEFDIEDKTKNIAIDILKKVIKDFS